MFAQPRFYNGSSSYGYLGATPIYINKVIVRLFLCLSRFLPIFMDLNDSNASITQIVYCLSVSDQSLKKEKDG